MVSETHLFNPTLINEFRFGYNWDVFRIAQLNANIPAPTLIPGMGGVPFTGLAGPNGGLPRIGFTTRAIGISHSRSRGYDIPSIQRQNVYQILDNVTKIHGSHSFKFGFQIESIRPAFAQSVYPRGILQLRRRLQRANGREAAVGTTAYRNRHCRCL